MQKNDKKIHENNDAIYNLSDDEFTLAKTKNTDKNRLGFCSATKIFSVGKSLDLAPKKRTLN